MTTQVTAQELAAVLLYRLRQRFGYMVRPEQVDFYDCSLDDPASADVMVHCWYRDGAYGYVLLEHAPQFDACEVELEMLRGACPVRVH
jgi:hypothetical protein